MSASAANSVLAKARAMYGKRLTAQNYSELLSCRTVGETAAYLKTHTVYSNVFDGVPMGSLHRRQLESLVHNHLSSQFASLCRYEKFIGDKFYEYFVMKSDVEMLLHAIRNINRNDTEEFPKTLPSFFYRHSDVDASLLHNISDLESLLKTVENSRYKSVLAPFVCRGEDGSPDYFGMELSLAKYFYCESEKLVKKSYKGSEKQELLDYLGFVVDLQNIVSVYRLKRLTNMPNATLRTMLMPCGKMGEKELNKMLSAKSADEALLTLEGTEYDLFSKRGESSVEEVKNKLRYNYCKNKIRFSAYPSIVMLCYVRLAENEVDNITHIIEGIRYNIASEEINRLLIGVGD